jgi:nicotinate phosphoribosyltransferase
MASQSTAQLLSLLDNDFYKFTMQQAVMHLFPDARVRYKFINRSRHSFPAGFSHALRDAVDSMAELQLTREEKRFLKITCPYLDDVYLDFLEGYRYRPDEIAIKQNNDQLELQIEGPWFRTILWEVPIMALICELYYNLKDSERISNQAVIECTRDKIERYRALGVTVAEFGTRRRYSYDVHRLVLQALKQYGTGAFIGSSNVHMAMLHQTRPIGTHAHEWFMFHAARYGFQMANVKALDNWVKIYRGDLGIALSDTYTTEVFFRQFDKMFSKLFDGVRHDSGDPLLFADNVIDHYLKLGIDPKTKSIIFSDALNYEKVSRIADHCKDKIGISFGIGTNLTNDAGVAPMNIVIKMSAAKVDNDRWTDVVKLSDEHGKHTGNQEIINMAKEVLGIQ